MKPTDYLPLFFKNCAYLGLRPKRIIRALFFDHITLFLKVLLKLNTVLMPKKMLFYSALVLIIANHTFQEYFGLNPLIIAFSYVLLTALVKTDESDGLFLKSDKWWLYANASQSH